MSLRPGLRLHSGCLSFKMKVGDRDEKGRTLVYKGLHAMGFRSTGLVRESNQVRLGAIEYPMACLYTGETVLSIAREGNES
jgi:hypothetical protein